MWILSLEADWLVQHNLDATFTKIGKRSGLAASYQISIEAKRTSWEGRQASLSRKRRAAGLCKHPSASTRVSRVGYLESQPQTSQLAGGHLHKGPLWFTFHSAPGDKSRRSRGRSQALAVCRAVGDASGSWTASERQRKIEEQKSLLRSNVFTHACVWISTDDDPRWVLGVPKCIDLMPFPSKSRPAILKRQTRWFENVYGKAKALEESKQSSERTKLEDLTLFNIKTYYKAAVNRAL